MVGGKLIYIRVPGRRIWAFSNKMEMDNGYTFQMNSWIAPKSLSTMGDITTLKPDVHCQTWLATKVIVIDSECSV